MKVQKEKRPLQEAFKDNEYLYTAITQLKKKNKKKQHILQKNLNKTTTKKF